MNTNYIQQKAEALYPIEIETPTQGVSFDVNEDERNAYIQGYQDGQEGSAGVRVKASERTPSSSNLVHIWDTTGKTNFMTTGFYENGTWYRQNGDVLQTFRNIEWLDESTPSTPLCEAAEAMYKALKDLMNGVSQLPPLAAIAGVLVKEYEVAKQAIDNYEKLNK